MFSSPSSLPLPIPRVAPASCSESRENSTSTFSSTSSSSSSFSRSLNRAYHCKRSSSFRRRSSASLRRRPSLHRTLSTVSDSLLDDVSTYTPPSSVDGDDADVSPLRKVPYESFASFDKLDLHLNVISHPLEATDADTVAPLPAPAFLKRKVKKRHAHKPHHQPHSTVTTPRPSLLTSLLHPSSTISSLLKIRNFDTPCTTTTTISRPPPIMVPMVTFSESLSRNKQEQPVELRLARNIRPDYEFMYRYGLLRRSATLFLPSRQETEAFRQCKENAAEIRRLSAFSRRMEGFCADDDDNREAVIGHWRGDDDYLYSYQQVSPGSDLRYMDPCYVSVLEFTSAVRAKIDCGDPCRPVEARKDPVTTRNDFVDQVNRFAIRNPAAPHHNKPWQSLREFKTMRKLQPFGYNSQTKTQYMSKSYVDARWQ